MPSAERARLSVANPERPTTEERRRVAAWRSFGPYLSERSWGTVREDYSPLGDAWTYFPHDHARSRTYRWNEDGLAGVCDDQQHLCFALALWNGQDPILKERIFGLSGPEGNHGEDAKEYWWYLDAVPSHSWMRWRYHYPQAAFPYDDLVATNLRRTKHEPEYELLDTGVFDDDRYWVVTVDYAKSDPDDLSIRITAENVGPDPATLHLLPTLWFRNTWSWVPGSAKPSLAYEAPGLVSARHPEGGTAVLTAGPVPGTGVPPRILFCENETNDARIFGLEDSPAYPKDGINDHVVSGQPTVNPEQTGTKAAAWYQVTAAPGETVEVRLRLARNVPGGSVNRSDVGEGFEAVMTDRRAEADEFYGEVLAGVSDPDRRLVARQAFAGMLWTLQHYHYDVRDWLAGDLHAPAPPASRQWVRNGGWRHFSASDVLSMPDKWEYPWFATWDLAFHTVVLAHVDPDLAKQQLLLLCREWYMHPNGQLAAYEWQFSDVNPPVHAWAALKVFEIDGSRDWGFLERIFTKLIANFTWWLNLKDTDDNNLFEGGFLGLDNIGPFDRSRPPDLFGGKLEQCDATAWMARYSLDMLALAVRLASHDPFYEDMAIKFAFHFGDIADAINAQGMWDEEEGFYFDQISFPDGSRLPIRVRSMVGLLATTGVASYEVGHIAELDEFVLSATRKFLEDLPHLYWGRIRESYDQSTLLLAIATPDRLRTVLRWVLDEERFLSPGGLRSLSRYHRDHPAAISIGSLQARVEYEPAESTTGLFGGNSNWRGPVWFPVNYLIIESLRAYHAHLGPEFTVECPSGSGQMLHLGQVADHLAERLVRIFTLGPDGRRLLWADSAKFQSDPRWRDQLLFFEYFHGDTGAGLGASHQTGWTGLVADLILGLDGKAEA